MLQLQWSIYLRIHNFCQLEDKKAAVLLCPKKYFLREYHKSPPKIVAQNSALSVFAGRSKGCSRKSIWRAVFFFQYCLFPPFTLSISLYSLFFLPAYYSKPFPLLEWTIVVGHPLDRKITFLVAPTVLGKNFISLR